MIESVDFDIVGSYNNQRISNIDCERSVNCFEYRDPLGKKPRSLIGTSGLINGNFMFTGGTGGVRAQFYAFGYQFVVISSNIYRINSGGTVVRLYTSLSNSTGYVGVDANTFQVTFVNGENGYVYDNVTQVVTEITDPAFPVNPIDVCTLDNFTVVANGNSNNFQLSMFDQSMVWGASPDIPVTTTNSSLPNQLILPAGAIEYFQTGVPVQLTPESGGLLPSGLNQDDTYYAIVVDATHIKLATTLANSQAGTPVVMFEGDITPVVNLTNTGQLQEGSITTHPGTIVACRTLHQKLFLFSQFYTEVWENNGIGTNLPFRRNNSLLIEYGTPAIGSIDVGFDKMFFLSQSRGGLGPIMMVIGAQAIPVSNRALNSQLVQYAQNQQISDCRAFMIEENGIIFYRMNFTAANHTFVYNVSLSDPTGQENDRLWHEEEVLNGDRHPAQTHAYFNGQNYVGDYENPSLYIVSSTTYGNNIYNPSVQNSANIHRYRITRPFMNEGSNRRRIDRIFIDMLQGNIPQNSYYGENAPTPYVYFSVSKDGGRTYGTKYQLPYGQPGQLTFRTVIRKLGVIPRGQAFVCRVDFYAQVPFCILGASWVSEVLPQ